MTDNAALPSLTRSFEPATRQDWLDIVTKALKGADYARRLVARTADGIGIEPVYARRADATAITGAVAAGRWMVTARVDHPDATAAAAQAVADLDGGAGGLALVMAGSPSARGHGLTVETVGDLDAALDGVMLDLIQVRLEPGATGRVDAALLAALCARRGYKAEALAVDFGFDPIGTLASTGSLPAPWLEVGRRLAEAIRSLQVRGFKGPFITIDLRPYHEAGASEAQEVGVALAAAVAYARALELEGFTAADAFAAMSLTLAVDADELMGLAKLRALRRLWARVAESCGAAGGVSIHAETAWRMMTRTDAAVNMLRSTTAVFASGVGGADSVTVLPHTSALGLPDALSRRIARNTQLVLQEESHLWCVADPAAGAGAIEALTDEVGGAAWKIFQAIEADGGLVASLTRGLVQGRIAAVATTRARDIATRKLPLTGTSEFPNLAETAAGTLDVAAVAPIAASGSGAFLSFDALIAACERGARRADLAPPHSQGLTATPLPSLRLSEPFERLRARAAAASAAGKRPTVFLANLGTLAEFGARATWISNLLAAGGIAVAPGAGFTASQDAGAAFAASGAAIACICGTDETYGLLAETTAQALKAAGATRVLLAGRPGEGEAAMKAAGIDQFVFAGQDVLVALGELHRAFGLSA